MTPQDFKALLDELKDINKNLHLVFKSIYLLTLKEDEKTIKITALDRLYRHLEVSATPGGLQTLGGLQTFKDAEKRFKEALDILKEIINEKS